MAMRERKRDQFDGGRYIQLATLNNK